MPDFLPNLVWYIAAGLMLGFGAMVVLNRNPVSSALSLVVSFIGLAILLIKLDAMLLGILQILVYAGAVMVLFLFIIMLMDLRAEVRRKLNIPAVIGGALIGSIMIGVIAQAVMALPGADKPLTDIPLAQPEVYNDVVASGKLLYTKYVFHIQVMGLLLLTATIGVIMLSKKDTTKSDKVIS